MRRCAATVAFVLVAAAAFAATASAAAPWLIIVSGDPLDELVYLVDWDQNAVLQSEVTSTRAVVDEAGLTGRPVLDIAQFWGDQGRDRPLHELRPEDADLLHGRFYPAVGASEAVIQLPLAEHPEPVLASAKVLEILARAGVPTRVTEPVDETPWRAIVAAPLAVAALALAIFGVRRRCSAAGGAADGRSETL